MTRKSRNEEAQSELSWEEAVGRYLEENPDYLVRRPDVLARIDLAHEVGGRAVSLIEHQVRVLRERNVSLEHQLHDLVAIARENDSIGNRLHRFGLAMLDSRSLEDVLDAAYELLRKDFKLDAIAIRILVTNPAAYAREECVAGDDRKLNALLGRLDRGKTACGAQDRDLTAYLFGDAGNAIESCALIPLGEARPRGVLALGSHDVQRFAASMGTMHLTKLGEMLLHALSVKLSASA